MTIDTLCKKAGVKRTTGQKAIIKLLSEGKLSRFGTGTKSHPYRFFAPQILSAGTAIF